ncbi:MAG: hypothetical protein ACREN6_17340 [Gemmatimonadaceae bacterium]
MSRWPALLTLAVLAGVLLLPVAGETTGHRFFSSLRLAKPTPVSAVASGNPNRALPVLIGNMLADSVSVTREEPDVPVADLAAAGKLAGFTPKSPVTNAKLTTVIVTGARDARAVLHRSQLATTLVQAGLGRVATDPSLEGAVVRFSTPRGVRQQFGHCPQAAPATLQGQLQGPPPPSTDYGDCVVLTVTPATDGTVPATLDLPQLAGIALELSGMSPAQTTAFQARLDWRSTMSLSLPRGMRSYDTVDVAGARGMLLNTANRRGPTYTLVWSVRDTVYALSGYGSAADAAPLARSLR